MDKISLVVSAFNEEKNLPVCLGSVANLVDEIIVIDNQSSDNTGKVAASFGASIYTRPNSPILNINKNYGFSKAKNKWILNLDADEELTPELKEEIKKVINSPLKNNEEKEISGFWMPRKNLIFGKWIKHGIWWPDFQLRLFIKGKGIFPEKHVHEYLKVEGETKKMANFYLHHNYQTISQFIRKMNDLYTPDEVANQSHKYSLENKPEIIIPAFADFFKNYFFQEGYKDGRHGFVLSVFQAFYTFLVKAKLWEKSGFPDQKISLEDFRKELTFISREFNYWFLTASINSTDNLLEKTLFRIKRRLLHFL